MLPTRSENPLRSRTHERRRSYPEVMRLVEEANVAARMGALPQAFRLFDSAYGFEDRSFLDRAA